ncbi:hypothetical protein AB5N19_14168 [Seiridium cardinale]
MAASAAFSTIAAAAAATEATSPVAAITGRNNQGSESNMPLLQLQHQHQHRRPQELGGTAQEDGWVAGSAEPTITLRRYDPLFLMR